MFHLQEYFTVDQPTSTFLFRLCCLAASATLVGCGPSQATVGGSVSFAGTPVAKGEIVFTATDGSGSAVGASISNGQYAIKLLPGECIVTISDFPDVAPVQSTADLQRQAEANGNRPVPSQPFRNQITTETVGNNQTVILKAGSQKLDFALLPVGSK